MYGRHLQSVSNKRARVSDMSDMTWAGWVEAWRTYLVAGGRAAGTVELRRYHLRRLAEFVEAGPAEVDSDAIAAFLAGAQWAANTRRSTLVSIRQFFKWAISTGRRDDDPTDAVPRVSPVLGRPRPCPEVAVHAAIRHASTRVRLMIALGATAGLRRAEITRVRGDDVHPAIGGPILVVRGKGDKVREVPITDELAAMIAAEAPNGGWCFPSPERNGPLTPAHVGKLIARTLPGAWTTHTLRHRFASAAYAADRDIRAVQELLGHASVATTQIYTAIPAEAARRAVASASSTIVWAA